MFSVSNTMKHVLRTVLFSIQEITFSKRGVQLAVIMVATEATHQAILNSALGLNFMPSSAALVKNLSKKRELLKEVAAVEAKVVFRSLMNIIQEQVVEVPQQFTTRPNQ